MNAGPREAHAGGACEPSRRRGDAREPSVRRIVVLHGLWMPPALSTMLLCRRLEAAGYDTTVFGYASVACDLDENAARLAAFAAALPERRLHFVGHSLGGVVIVRMLQRHGGGRAARAVCLGSPLTACHGGGMLLRFGWGRRIVGRSIADIAEGRGVEPWRGGCELGILAGDRPYGFGRLLGGLPMPNDGTVAVAETRLDGAVHRVLHVNHTALLWDRQVAAETVHFLRHGTFSAQGRTSAASS